MGINLSSLSGLVSQLGNLLPSGASIVENLVVGAATNTVVKGLQAGGADALDPLHLFPHPANNPASVQSPTITASAFATLPPAAQATFLTAGGHIVAG